MDESMSPMSDASLSAGEILLRLTASATLAAGALLHGAGSATLTTLALGTAGRVLVAGASAPAWSDAGLSYSSGVLAIAGSVPGTPSAGQVLIGGGDGKFSGALSCTALSLLQGAIADRAASDTALSGPYLSFQNSSAGKGGIWQVGTATLDLWNYNGSWGKVLSFAQSGGAATFAAGVSCTVVNASGNVNSNLGVFGEYAPTANARQVQIGWNGTNYAIQAVQQDIGYQNLKLNPSGGAVECGAGFSCTTLTLGTNVNTFIADGQDYASDSRLGFRPLGSTTIAGVRLVANSTTAFSIDACTFDSGGSFTAAKILDLNPAGGLVRCGGLVSVGGSTPASAAATGTAGTITWDASYLYVCTATDTWKRVAIATW